MIYLIFIIIAVAYNVRKFLNIKDRFLRDISDSPELRRNTILSHFYWVFVVELFVGLLASLFISKDSSFDNIFKMLCLLLSVTILGYCIFHAFLKKITKEIDPEIPARFAKHMIKESRITFTLGFLPIMVYSGLAIIFADDMGTAFWGLEAFGHVLVISVLSITCTVTFMMKLLPNCEVTESEYLSIIEKRLEQSDLSYLRVRWIEAEFKNAFVVGFNFPFFRNQTLFIGRNLRETLSFSEFDAVICHELAHIKKGHMASRVVSLFWHLTRVGVSTLFVLMAGIYGGAFVYGIEVQHYSNTSILFCLAVLQISMFIISNVLFFDAVKAQEYEADATAVFDFGCSIDVLESTLRKLVSVDNPYISPKTKNALTDLFSTHPSIEDRIDMLHRKQRGEVAQYSGESSLIRLLPFLFSRNTLRIHISVGFIFCLGLLYFIQEKRIIENKRETIVLLSNDELMKNEYLIGNINDRPFIGHSNLYYVMIRKDIALIDFFIEKGANHKKVLSYLLTMNEHELSAHYLIKLSDKLSDDEFEVYASRMIRSKISDDVLFKLQESERFNLFVKLHYPNKIKTGAERLPASIISNPQLME